MNRLERLIHRIVNPIKVSTEDAWDSVKGYWDDVVGNYWADVDEDLTEELGVTPVALSELLEVHRHTFDYANIGGNSSVRGYDHGEGWFVVMFSDGSRYLYTLKSTTPEALDWMRKYAMEGKGLNSYLMRLQRENYAGRNYKGTITIRPGMESYNPLGHRRLKLLQAFRNTMAQTSVSNEGLMADVKKFFGMSNKSAQKLFIDNTFGWSVIQHLERDLLRPEWLKDQTYNKGEVSGKSVLKYIGKNGNVDMPGAFRQMDAFLAARVRVKKLTDTWRQKTKPAADVLIKNARKLTPAVYAEAKELMAKIPMEKYTIGYPTTPIVGNGVKHENPKRVDLVYTPVDKMIPALDESEALKLAADMRRSMDEFKKNMTAAPDEWPDVMHEMVYSMQPKDYGGVPYSDWYDLIWDILSPDTVEKTHAAGMIANRIYWDTIVGLARYLDVSIKGDSIISGESFKVSPSKNEALMHNTLKRYKDQITQAGPDGLDPVARKLMSVGLESMGTSVQVSLEAETSPTKSIETIIDRALLGKYQASNESIWGAVRYLFGGNYENAPKINAAYEEAVDAVKSTYGNPQWVEKRRLAGKPVKVKSYINVAKAASKALESVKKTNQPTITANLATLKKEVEYIGKYVKFLTSSERGDEDKAESLLDMFDRHFSHEFEIAPEVNMGGGGEVPALDKTRMLETANVFISAVKYRMETDLLHSSGIKKMMYTDGGRERWGDDGTETGKLQGASKELAEAVGERLYSIQEDYYQAHGHAWLNADAVVEGCLMYLEASAN